MKENIIYFEKLKTEFFKLFFQEIILIGILYTIGNQNVLFI